MCARWRWVYTTTHTATDRIAHDLNTTHTQGLWPTQHNTAMTETLSSISAEGNMTTPFSPSKRGGKCQYRKNMRMSREGYTLLVRNMKAWMKMLEGTIGAKGRPWKVQKAITDYYTAEQLKAVSPRWARWDMYWHALSLYRANNPTASHYDTYGEDLLDDHIDTALKAVMKEIGLAWASA